MNIIGKLIKIYGKSAILSDIYIMIQKIVLTFILMDHQPIIKLDVQVLVCFLEIMTIEI